jgi:hypothetical protein
MMRSLLFLLSIMMLSLSAEAQCKFSIDEVDEFDSTRLVAYRPIPIGDFIPSRFETVKGARIIDQATLIFSHTESDQDSVNSFFLTIVVPEYEYQPIESGQNVMIAFSDSAVVALLNFPDRGIFDVGTNMRLYQHTCVVPVDVFYRLAYADVLKIRIRYANQKKTFTLTKKQQKELKAAVRCVGEAVGFIPIKP